MERESQYKALIDEDLALLVMQGNHFAFAVLVKRNVTRFYKLAFSILHSKQLAEDVVQDCFLKFWQEPNLWKSEANVKFSTWFSKVISNKSYDYLRKKKSQSLDNDFDIADDAKTAEEIIAQNQQTKAFEDAFSELDEKQQKAISLTFFDRQKNEKAAKIMNMNLKAFQSFLLRSKQALRENFKKLN
jgi:RNA polymerase sigma-70 factor (ECF subfamily)